MPQYTCNRCLASSSQPPRTKSASLSDSVSKPTDGSTVEILIGPPDRISNIRPIKYHINETQDGKYVPRPKLKEYLKYRQDMLLFTHKHWEAHNKEFEEAFEKWQQKNQEQEPGQENDHDSGAKDNQEIGVFYKIWLQETSDKQWQFYKDYFRKNCRLLVLAFNANMETLRRKMV